MNREVLPLPNTPRTLLVPQHLTVPELVRAQAWTYRQLAIMAISSKFEI